MPILSIILFSLATNIDNISLGISYGIKKISINMYSNLSIAIITSTTTALSLIVGEKIISFFPFLNKSIGSIILIFMGTYYLTKYAYNYYLVSLKKPPITVDITTYDKDKSGDINIIESIVIGLSLSLNNLGLGLSVSALGFPLVLTSIFVFICSFLSILLGKFIGISLLSKVVGKYSEPISGLLVITIGIITMCK